jgi:hypothetical protein
MNGVNSDVAGGLFFISGFCREEFAVENKNGGRSPVLKILMKDLAGDCGPIIIIIRNAMPPRRCAALAALSAARAVGVCQVSRRATRSRRGPPLPVGFCVGRLFIGVRRLAAFISASGASALAAGPVAVSCGALSAVASFAARLSPAQVFRPAGKIFIVRFFFFIRYGFAFVLLVRGGKTKTRGSSFAPCRARHRHSASKPPLRFWFTCACAAHKPKAKAALHNTTARARGCALAPGRGLVRLFCLRSPLLFARIGQR